MQFSINTLRDVTLPCRLKMFWNLTRSLQFFLCETWKSAADLWKHFALDQSVEPTDCASLSCTADATKTCLINLTVIISAVLLDQCRTFNRIERSFVCTVRLTTQTLWWRWRRDSQQRSGPSPSTVCSWCSWSPWWRSEGLPALLPLKQAGEEDTHDQVFQPLRPKIIHSGFCLCVWLVPLSGFHLVADFTFWLFRIFLNFHCSLFWFSIDMMMYPVCVYWFLFSH